MNDLSGRGPLGLKVERLPDDPGRLELIHYLPCAICNAWGMPQNSPTEAHHCKSGRFSTRKEADRYTIPICHSHHNKLKPYPGDEAKIGFHNAQETWEAEYGRDYEWLDWTDDQLAKLLR